MFAGRRVISHTGRWMWDYDDIPVTITSAIEGWRMEAYFRRNPSLCLEDIQGRMPIGFKHRHKGKEETKLTWPDTALRNRLLRFRYYALLPAWVSRFRFIHLLKK